uniref:Ligand dependent nuclear receptor corepressor-like n=1 Tax=Dicentrarchus labrax TaxID=13489 RepID=A0A8C4IXN3_DICLA
MDQKIRQRDQEGAMATVQCCKCTAERKGFRRELDSWRHKLIHCVGMIHVQFFLFHCEPEEVDDWSPEASCSQCSFCNLPLDKLNIPLGCDSNIPLVAQELMKKMIHQFALEYASKCLLHTSTNGVTTRTSSPLSETSDAPLDLTVSRTQEEKESESEPGRESKLAHEEKLLLLPNHRPVDQIESHCCHCGVNPQDNVTPNAVPFSECKVHNSCPYYPLTDCDHQGHSSTMYSPGDSKSNCSIHHYPLTDRKSEAPQDSSYCSLQSSKSETCPVLFPKRLHCISCQSLAVGRIKNTVCSFVSSPSNITETGVGDGDPPCPVLKREQSPSPPPLSPIPSDINKKSDEKPPSLLHHGQEEEADLMVKDGLVNGIHQETDLEKDGTSLQDVMDRFCEKLETIRPIEKDPPSVSTAIYVSEKEQPQSPLTSQNVQFHADSQLTEIITTVLHTGSASDYNLSELFNRHDSKEPKSPNTRLRRRQEVLAAIATPTDDASTRRQTLKIKRDLAMFDQSYSKRKVPLSKRARLKDGKATVTTSNTSSDSNLVKEESKREMEADVEPVEKYRIREGPLNILTAEGNRNEVKEEIETVTVTEVQIIKAEEKETEISSEEKDLTLSATQIPNPELQCKYGNQGTNSDCVQTKVMTVTATSAKQHCRPCEEDGIGRDAGSNADHEEVPSAQHSDSRPDCHCPVREKQKCQSHHSNEGRRSRRNIVPPQRFSSYVTEPRKMFFAACFSESIFNQKTQKEKASTSSTPDALSKDPGAVDTQLESRSLDKASTCSTQDALSRHPDAKDTQLESRNKTHLSLPEHTCKPSFESMHREQCGSTTQESNNVLPQTVVAKEKSPKKHKDNGTDDSDCGAKPFGRLRSSPKRLQDLKTSSRTPQNTSNIDVIIKSASCVESPPSSQAQYTSPIKLMFVSPVKDSEGVRYSLKSAGAGSSGQAVEPFDPCEESSWSGTLQKHKSQSPESVTSRVKSISSPLKSATSPAKSAFSPSKSASSPAKSASSPAKSASSPSKSSSPAKSASSPKSASSSPKTCSRRSGEGTPTKRIAGTECQRSPGDSLSFHETTPPKRRPGRPKKLGPQLEQKVKRPIGRPPKPKAVDSVIGTKTVNGKSDLPSDVKENVNKNLKITVVYGRSRRNKRTVSEGFEQLQTEFHHAWQAVRLKSDLGMNRALMHNSNISSGSVKTTSTELSKESNFVSPLKESTPQSSSNIKCQKRDDSVPSRKPGRPAKVKISGISVTVTTVSPRQRKIQINKDTRQSPESLIRKKKLLPEFKTAKEPWTISCQSTSKSSPTEEGIETKDESKDKLQNQPVAVRHSMRVRKPSIHFLHAVATSAALLRRSKKLLLNKASNERRQAGQQINVETLGEKRQLCGQERKNISQDLSKVAEVSVDSIFTPKETLRWWAASAQGKTMNQELARRIRLISDTWVSDTVENQEKEIAFNSKLGTKSNRKSKHSSVVRTLFDCSPNKPRSCSMQQLCSWFMQTTETQSLAIVKKASSRNPYELMHFPRTTNKKSVCHSPQAERLRKHIKKFAKTVPKSPLQHQRAQRRLRKRIGAPRSTRNIRRQLFTPRSATGRLNQGDQWRKSSIFGKYQATLFRASTRFLTRKEREKWRKRQRNKKNMKLATSFSNALTGLQPKRKASAKYQLSDCLENSSTLKECRVFLRKINSPDNESTEEECDSCTVTLDDGSLSAYLFAGRERELVGVVKAVKTERKRSMKRTASRELAGSATKSVQEQDEMPVGRQKGKYKSPGVVSTEPPQPPPAKMLRQSRMRGLTGPRWCDFVLGNYLAHFFY